MNFSYAFKAHCWLRRGLFSILCKFFGGFGRGGRFPRHPWLNHCVIWSTRYEYYVFEVAISIRIMLQEISNDEREVFGHRCRPYAERIAVGRRRSSLAEGTATAPSRAIAVAADSAWCGETPTKTADRLCRCPHAAARQAPTRFGGDNRARAQTGELRDPHGDKSTCNKLCEAMAQASSTDHSTTEFKDRLKLLVSGADCSSSFHSRKSFCPAVALSKPNRVLALDCVTTDEEELVLM